MENLDVKETEVITPFKKERQFTIRKSDTEYFIIPNGNGENVLVIVSDISGSFTLLRLYKDQIRGAEKGTVFFIGKSLNLERLL